MVPHGDVSCRTSVKEVKNNSNKNYPHFQVRNTGGGEGTAAPSAKFKGAQIAKSKAHKFYQAYDVHSQDYLKNYQQNHIIFSPLRPGRDKNTYQGNFLNRWKVQYSGDLKSGLVWI